MNGNRLRVHPVALDEAEAAIDWYAQRSRRAAEMFLDELERAIGGSGGSLTWNGGTGVDMMASLHFPGEEGNRICYL